MSKISPGFSFVQNFSFVSLSLFVVCFLDEEVVEENCRAVMLPYG